VRLVRGWGREDDVFYAPNWFGQRQEKCSRKDRNGEVSISEQRDLEGSIRG
jgi:hypothetical protein